MSEFVADRFVRPSVELEALERLMRELGDGIPNQGAERLGAIVREHLDGGGKRLRARLAYSAAEIMGVAAPRVAGFAAACEILHQASLLHDDVQDEDRLRRGRPTAWVRHGIDQAINAGDLLLICAFRALEHVPCDDGMRWRLTCALTRAAEATVRGQSAELDLLTSGQLSFDAYAASARGKTGAFFALPVQGAALLSGQSVEGAHALAAPFGDLGLFFQMHDDILDLSAHKGRSPGTDIAKGKVTAVLVEYIAGQGPQSVAAVLDVLRCPAPETPRGDIDSVISAFRSSGALDRALLRANAVAQAVLAHDALMGWPELHAVAAGLIDRVSGILEAAEPAAFARAIRRNP